MAKVAVLVGSVRSQSNTARAAAVLVEELKSAGATVDLVDPRALDRRLPGSAGNDEVVAQVTADLKRRVGAADGVLLVTPEYDGSYSAVMKLLLEHLGYPSVLAGKPVALLGVASGAIGAARAVDHLRAVLVHIGALAIPPFRFLATVHKGVDQAGRITDPGMDSVIRAVARQLLDYLKG
jgi:FMN reductase